ncbi:MAG: type II toxin-antitoxin system HipA family toxin [Opitutales bacterium]
MSEALFYVYCNLDGQDVPVGRLWSYYHNGKESASFKYEESWLRYLNNFELEPFLPLTEGTFHTDNRKALFASFEDCAPDSWGRLLIKRNEAKMAQAEKRPRRQFREIDFLTQLNDFSRQGALRFKREPKGDFLTQTGKKIPSIMTLSKLLMASENVLTHNETFSDLKELLIPGSSLGGSRPKASVVDGKNLYIAKFPKQNDNAVHWEAVALTLAQQAGLRVQQWRMVTINNKLVLLAKRFDRQGEKRIPFFSAMTLLNANDGESGNYSYLNLADIITTRCVHVKNDLRELWSRMLFSILISNTDDHLRNHGFLRNSPHGLELSPLYDVNPNPDRTSHLQLNITEDDSSTSIDLALSVSEYFRLTKQEANAILTKQRSAVAQWRSIAQYFGLSASEQEEMEPAFQHVL